MYWVIVKQSLVSSEALTGKMHSCMMVDRTSGLGLDDMSLAWPAVVQLLVFIYSGIQSN